MNIFILVILLGLTSLSKAYANDLSTYTEIGAMNPILSNFIRKQMNLHETDDLRVHIKQLDNRLKLRPCADELKLSIAGMHKIGPRHTVTVQCETKNPWTLYIPVQVELYKPVVVTQQYVAAQEVITPEHLKLTTANILALDSGFFDDFSLVLGKVAKQSIRAESIINAHHLNFAKIVKRGQLLNIIKNKSSFKITMQGKALQDGYLGENIRVENIHSKRIIEGLVLNSHEIAIKGD